jgi:ribonuclease T2
VPSFRRQTIRLLGFLLVTLTVASVAFAQLRWDDSGRNTRQQDVAGKFDYYALVLSWSPTHCSSEASADDEMQCNRRDGKRYSFVLHGLWPQYTRGWPQSCRLPRQPFVPDNVIAGMLDIMPSRGLVIHEYRKHGTCSGLDAASYFQLARQLFKKVRIPNDYVNPFETQFVTPANLKRAFVAANPGLPAEAIAISCARGGRGRLREIRICLSRDGMPVACGPNEDERKLCSATEMAVPPVRSTKRDDDALAFPRQSPLPMPR